jgi:recombination associated protein RdgC
LFRFPAGIDKRFKKLDAQLAEHALRPCGPLELQTRGWVSPYGRGEDMFAIEHGVHALLALGGEDKIPANAPSSTSTLPTRPPSWRSSAERPVGATASVASSRTTRSPSCCRGRWRGRAASPAISIFGKRLGGGRHQSSRKAAEGFVSGAAQRASAAFPPTGLEPEESPRALMTEWMIDAKLPPGFALGDECELKDPADNGAIVRCRRQDLGGRRDARASQQRQAGHPARAHLRGADALRARRHA